METTTSLPAHTRTKPGRNAHGTTRCSHGPGIICPRCEDEFAERQGLFNPDAAYLRRDIAYSPRTMPRTSVVELVSAKLDAEANAS